MKRVAENYGGISSASVKKATGKTWREWLALLDHAGAANLPHKEIARFPVLSGKTWNHPVVVRDVLLVRNGEEMAAFRLSPAAQTAER